MMMKKPMSPDLDAAMSLKQKYKDEAMSPHEDDLKKIIMKIIADSPEEALAGLDKAREVLKQKMGMEGEDESMELEDEMMEDDSDELDRDLLKEMYLKRKQRMG